MTHRDSASLENLAVAAAVAAALFTMGSPRRQPPSPIPDLSRSQARTLTPL